MSTIKIVIIIVVSGLFIQSCKKGENDPFLSLKTRDARFTGTWELVSSEAYELGEYAYNGSGYFVSQTETELVENGMITHHFSETVTYNGETEIYTDETEMLDYSETLLIEKNGDFISTTIQDQDSYEYKKSWYWLGTATKKTQVFIEGMVYQINRLTNKELILKAEENEKEAYSPDGELYIETFRIKKVFKKKK